MNDQEPSMHLKLGSMEFEATPRNTRLYTFLGKTAINGIEFDNQRFDHVFFETGQTEEGIASGTYMHRTDRNEEVFDTITSYMAEASYPMFLNQREVPQCDIDAYFRLLDQLAEVDSEDIGDFLPEGWE